MNAVGLTQSSEFQMIDILLIRNIIYKQYFEYYDHVFAESSTSVSPNSPANAWT